MTEIDQPTDKTGPFVNTTLSTETISTQLKSALFEALQDSENTLIRAPTGIGKSYLAATTRWRGLPEITGGRPVIIISATREARDDAVEKGRAAGMDYYVLRGREEACPVAGGEYDDDLWAPDGQKPSDWFDQKCDIEGVSFSEAHQYFNRQIPLPCSTGNVCKGISRYDDIPSDEDGNIVVDIIHTTATFAHHESLIKNANVIYDEQPDYRLTFEQETLRRAANEYLYARNPALSWESMMVAIQNEDANTKCTYWKSLTETSAELEPFGPHPHHARIRTIIQAILSATKEKNERFCGRCGDLTAVFDDRGTIRMLLNTPDLSVARCVVGFDAHPAERLWQANTGIDLQKRDIITTEQSRDWRRTDRGLSCVRIGPERYARPLTLGWRSQNRKQQAEVIINELHRLYPVSSGLALLASRSEVRSNK